MRGPGHVMHYFLRRLRLLSLGIGSPIGEVANGDVIDSAPSVRVRREVAQF